MAKVSNITEPYFSHDIAARGDKAIKKLIKDMGYDIEQSKDFCNIQQVVFLFHCNSLNTIINFINLDSTCIHNENICDTDTGDINAPI